MFKKNNLLYLLILILSISFLINIQCSDKSMNSPLPGNIGMDIKLTSSALLQMASQLHILVTAEDIDTIEVFAPLSEDDGFVFSEAIEVPSGSDRLFVVEVLDNNGVVLYRGEDIADVSNGVNLTLTIYLEPQVSLLKLTPRFNQKMTNSLLYLTFEVFNISDLYEIYFNIYFESQRLEFIGATIDTSLNANTTSLSVDIASSGADSSILDIVLKGTDNNPIVDENGDGNLVNLIFRCLDITNSVDSTYLYISYSSMFDPTGFPPQTDPPIMIDSNLVRIVTDIVPIDDTIPDIPVLLSPSDNAVGVELNPTLQWNVSDRAQLYNLVMATDVSFNDIFISPRYIDGTSYQAVNLSDNTTYYWQVQALNETGISEWSEIWSFTTLDNTPPARVTNLQISDTSGTSVTLAWTAPGDNINSGTAASYDIRYANNSSTLLSWNTATQVTNAPQPQTAGSSETILISGLELENWYYFALKTIDSSGNISAISNIDSIFLSSGFTIVPAGFAIDYEIMGASWKADWNTRTISFTWTMTGIGEPDGFKIYAKDNKTNTTYIEVGDIPYQSSTAQQTGTITLPTQFDSNTGDGIITPFSNGTIIDFDIRAYKNTFGERDFSGTPVSIRDETPPVFIINQIDGDGDNSYDDVTKSFAISLDRQLEYCPTSGNPTFSFIENGGDESYTLPVSSVSWFWDSSGRKDDSVLVEVPVGKCGAGDLLVVNISDNSNNIFSDTMLILPIITITNPTSAVTGFEAPVQNISWTFQNPPGTNYSNTLIFYLTFDNGATYEDIYYNFAYDVDLSRPYVINDSLMAGSARVGLQNDIGGNIWWSEPFQLNGIKLTHPTIEEIQSYEVIYDRGNLDSSLIPVNWIASGIDSFIIWYSIDTGSSWIPIDTVVNNNSYNLYPPNRGTSYYCWLAVSDADSDHRPIAIFDYDIYVGHDTMFTYFPEPGSILSGASSNYMEWMTSGGYGEQIKLQYSINGTDWINITDLTNTGYYSWNAPGNIPSTSLQIRIRDKFDLNTLLLFDKLSISGVSLLYPNGGEKFEGGTTQTFSAYVYDPLDQFTYFDAYISFNDWVDSTYLSSAFEPWVVPNVNTTNARIRVIEVELQFYDETDAPFIINGVFK